MSKNPNETWTIMVYLAADNNLAEEMIYALKSMNSVSNPGGHYRIVARYDFGPAPATFIFPPADPDQYADGLLVGAETERRAEAQAQYDAADRQLLIASKERMAAQKTLVAAGKALKAATDASQKNPQDKLIAATIRLAQERVADAEEALKKAQENQQRAQADLAEAERVLSGKARTPESVEAALTSFISTTAERYPADHFMLVLSGHGSGAVGDFLFSSKRLGSLSIPGLRRVLENSVGLLKTASGDSSQLDIVGMDSCLMSMTEVAHQICDFAAILIGAEGFEANTGWPYDKIIALLNGKPGISAKDFATEIVKAYLTFYGEDYTLADISADLAAIDLKTIEGIAATVGPLSKEGEPSGGLANLLAEGLDHPAIRDAIVLAHWEAQDYKSEQYTDLWDFCALLKARCGRITAEKSKELAERIAAACNVVCSAVEKATLISGYCGAAFQHSRALSIFFPWARMTDSAGVTDVEHYRMLSFARDTGWDEFLTKYHDRTQRKPRRGGDQHHSTLNRRDWLYTGAAGKHDPDVSTRHDPEVSTRHDPDVSTRTTAKGRSRIGSMKNPPTVWSEWTGESFPRNEGAKGAAR